MSKIRTSILAIIIILSLSFASNAHADAAPPRVPPGSSILPVGETMVQMLAESVVIVVGEPVRIDAVFAFRNQGGATESMQVRFPLEPLDGYGDGYGLRPQITNFEASVDGQPLPITNVEEPIDSEFPLTWATFPVSFPPGEDVLISVSYSTELGTSNDGLDQAQVDYILETGAGWYGVINSAVITLRLPYAASDSNVYLSTPWELEKVPPPVFVGREVRWEWTNLEPTSKDNLSAVFVHPDNWQHILDLEAATGANPRDVATAIELAEAYRVAGSERHFIAVSEPLYRLAKQAVQMALAHNPTDADLKSELLIIEMWKCYLADPLCAPDHVANLLQTYETMLVEQPDNARLAEIDYMPRELENSLRISATLTAQPPTDSSPTATEPPPATSTPLPQPTQTPVPTLVPTLLVTQASIANVPDEIVTSAPPFGVGVILGALGGMAAMLGVVGLFRMWKRK